MATGYTAIISSFVIRNKNEETVSMKINKKGN
jgi:hypothetical protein